MFNGVGLLPCCKHVSVTRLLVSYFICADLCPFAKRMNASRRYVTVRHRTVTVSAMQAVPHTPRRPHARKRACPTDQYTPQAMSAAPPPLPARSNLKHRARNNEEPRANRVTQYGAVASWAATPRCVFARVTPLIQFAITSSFSDRAAPVATCPDARTYERTRACTPCLRRARAHTHYMDGCRRKCASDIISPSPHVKRACPYGWCMRYVHCLFFAVTSRHVEYQTVSSSGNQCLRNSVGS